MDVRSSLGEIVEPVAKDAWIFAVGLRAAFPEAQKMFGQRLAWAAPSLFRMAGAGSGRKGTSEECLFRFPRID